MDKKADKQFPLSNRKNCAIYLNRIISSCERCMDRLKRYNEVSENILIKYAGREVVPIEVYSEMLDKTSSNICYLLNLLGDSQKSSISYFIFRDYVLKHEIEGVVLDPLNNLVNDLLKDFNRMRNWQNHIPESLLVAEMEQVKVGKMQFSMDPVNIPIYKTVTYAYFKDMIDVNINFYNAARKIIQAAKRDYKKIYGKSVTYNRVYTNRPLDFDKSIPTQKSAMLQGIKGNIGLDNNIEGERL